MDKTKQRIAGCCIAALLLFFGAGAFQYGQLSSFKNFDRTVAVEADGTVFAVKSGWFWDQVLRISAGGDIISIGVPAQNPFAVQRISELACWDGEVYALRQIQMVNSDKIRALQVLKISDPSDTVYRPQVIYEYGETQIAEGFTASGLHVDESGIYILFLGHGNKEVRADKLIAEDGEGYRCETVRTGGLSGSRRFIDAAWCGGALFASVNDGTLMEFSRRQAQDIPLPGGIKAAYLKSRPDELYIYNANLNAVYRCADGTVLPAERGEGGVIYGFDLQKEAGAVVYGSGEARALMIRSSGQEPVVYRKAGYSNAVYLLESGRTGAWLLAGLLAIVLLAVLLRRLSGRAGSFPFKTVRTAIPALFLGFVFGGIILFLITAGISRENQNILLESKAKLMVQQLAGEELSQLSSEQQESLLEGRDGCLTDIYAAKTGTIRAAVSSRYPVGAEADIILSAERYSELYQAMDTGRTVFYKDGKKGVLGCILPVESQSDTVRGLVTVEQPYRSMTGKAGYGALLYCLAALLLLSGMTVGLRRAAKRIQEPLARLFSSAEAVLKGNYTVDFTYEQADEFAVISKALSCLSSTIQEQHRQLSEFSSSCGRFVPDYILRALGRKSILEVQAGDSCELDGAMAVLNLHNLGNVEKKEKEKLLKLLSRISEAVSESARQWGGELIVNDCRFNELRVLFQEKDESCVQYAEELTSVLCSSEKLTGQLGEKPDCTILIGTEHMLCGVAGGEKADTPFLISPDMDHLCTVGVCFAGTGVQIVITREINDRLREPYQSRYIGFIRERKGNDQLELFELLPPSQTEENQMKRRNCGIFEKGLQAFYDGDFYTARAVFSAIVKSCPQDGIAKWYLFASDRYYSSPGERIYFELFGADAIRI